MHKSYRLFAVQLPITALCVNSLVALSIVSGRAAPAAGAKAKPAPSAAKIKPAASAAKVGARTKPAAAEAKDDGEDLPKDFPRPDIDGTVTKPDGSPAAGARVTWVTHKKDGSEDPNVPLVAVTDDQGRFHFDGKTAWARKYSAGSVIVQADGYALAGGRLGPDSDGKHPQPIGITLSLPSVAHARILSPQGGPAAGVAVRVSDVMKDRTYVSLTEQAGGGKVLSGADGIVSFPNLPQGWRANIVIDDPRYAQLQYPDNQQKVETAATTQWPDIKLVPAASVEGVLTTPDGKPVPNAGIEARTSGDPQRYGWTQTDENGHFLLKQMMAGDYTITEIPDPTVSAHWATRNTPYTLAAGDHKTGLKLSLVKGAIIVGHIGYRNSNKPAQGVGISVGRRAGREIDSSAYAATDASGNYRVCVAGGNISVNVQSSMSSQASSDVSAKDGETKTVDFTIDPPPAPVHIQGIVIDGGGKPVANADVTYSPLDFMVVQGTHSGPDGKFSLSVDNSPIIYVRARKGDAVTVKDIPALDGDNVTLKLQEGALAAIDGKVVDPDGKPITGAKISPIQWHIRFGSSLDTVVTDASGGYHVASVPPGYRYSLGVKADGFGSGDLDQLTPQPGQTLSADNITLKHTDSFVAGHVVDSHGTPLANASVFLTRDADKKATTDKQGKFRIDGVEPGDVLVQANAGDEWASVQVTAGKDNNVIKTYSQSVMNKRQVAQPKPVDYVGKYAPEFSVSNWVNVSPVSMSDLRGKIVIFDMWGCCYDSLFETQQAAQQFASHGVVAIGLNVSGNSLQEVQEHIAKEKLTLPIAIDKDTAKGLGGTGFECYSLVDRAGKVAYAGWDFTQLLAAMARIIDEDKK